MSGLSSGKPLFFIYGEELLSQSPALRDQFLVPLDSSHTQSSLTRASIIRKNSMIARGEGFAQTAEIDELVRGISN